MIDCLGPRRSTNVAFADAEELMIIQIPADLLIRRVAPINYYAIDIVFFLAAGAWQQPGPQTRRLITWSLFFGPARESSGMIAQAVRILENVDFAMLRPVPGPNIQKAGQ